MMRLQFPVGKRSARAQYRKLHVGEQPAAAGQRI